MCFDYKLVHEKSPCLVLVKNLRYFHDDIEKRIETGEIISFSQELMPLLAQLNRPSLNFLSFNQLKRFLYTQGFFSELELLTGNELIDNIESKNFSEIDLELNEDESCDEILKFLFDQGKLKKWDIMYDFGGTAYHEKNKLRDYQVYDETFDIRFFGGKDNSVLFDFIQAFFERYHFGNNTHELLKEIRFDFFEMMDPFDGEKQIYPYDLWREFLQLLFNKDLITSDVFDEYFTDKYF
jgi:hypothetical protein